jgi:hypothetical protein
VLGDTHYDAKNPEESCARGERFWLLPRSEELIRTPIGGGGKKGLPHVAQGSLRELQVDLRCTRGGAHQGTSRHRPLRFMSDLGLPAGAALPSRAPDEPRQRRA